MSSKALTTSGERLNWLQDIAARTPIYRLDPLRDLRWDNFVKTNSAATVFHALPWLEALRRTYGYSPVVYTTTPSGLPLRNGIVLCLIDSLVTGRRLVSLPFSDHCQPLAQTNGDLQALMTSLAEVLQESDYRYIEIRPVFSPEVTCSPWEPIAEYFHHQVELAADLNVLYQKFHKSSIQRKIQRALRERLTYRDDSAKSLLESFYRLILITRRRHGLPPQPREWFSNLIDCFGESLKIRLTLKGNKPIAGMLTLQFKDALVYKYGGSDNTVHLRNLGGMHLLYWRSIEQAKHEGLHLFDLGRTDIQQVGLTTFKRRWGAVQSKLTYWRYSKSGKSTHIFDPASNWKMRLARVVFEHAPTCSLPTLGSLLYKHIG